MMQELTQKLKEMTRAEIQRNHTAFPGQVVSFDAAKGLANIQPLVRYWPNGSKSSIEYPLITGVPVVFQQSMGQDVAVVFPVRAGDTGIVIISEKPLNYFLRGHETKEKLSFDLSNAMFIPGMFNSSTELIREADEDDALILYGNGSRVKMTKDKIAMKAVTIEIDGAVTVTGDVTAGGISLRGHYHDGDSGGKTSGPR